METPLFVACNYFGIFDQKNSGGDSKALSQQRFSKFALDYVTSAAHASGAELDRLVEIAQPQPDWTMLDVATGGGHTALKFAPMVSQVVASDITHSMLKVAQEFIAGHGIKNIVFGIADAESLPFEDKSFDLVTCRIAPHHFPNCLRFARESDRVLKPGGILLVQDHLVPEDKKSAQYINQFQRTRDPSHNRAFSESAWIYIFQKSGLKIKNTERIIKRHKFLPWAERQGCSQEVIQHLIKMVEDAPDSVIDWMQPKDFGTAEATFTDYHIIIAGVRSPVR
jgi:ubiquinone/menaquinone biosynthesis C-methylase UbiE